MRLPFSEIAGALMRPVLRRLVKATVMPADGIADLLDPARPICYVLQLRQLSALLVLEDTNRMLGLPSPRSTLTVGHSVESASSVYLTRNGQPSPLKRDGYRYAPRLERLVAEVSRAIREGEAGVDCQLVPVSVFWGQAPRNDDSLLRLLVADTWIVPGFFRQFLRVLVHGRQTLVRYGPPISLRGVLEDVAASGASESRSLRRVGRLLRERYQADRMQTIGPNLSHRQTVIESIVASPSVVEAIAADAASRGILPERAELRARQFAVEIAADFSYPTLRALNLLFTRVFSRLYTAIDATRFDVIGSAAGKSTIVYVPNHRSHIDYMVLHYVLLQRRMQVPHVAAGANLNLPLVGTILRRGGAFFLRRSFKGEALYAAVFERYLDTVIARGFPIEYFIEGGRSRTGRMLPPKSGLLAMTVDSHLRQPSRDIVFVPIHFGYERLVEGETYRAELAGQAKRKESLGALLRSLRVLRERFGRVRVNVGEPLSLAAFLQEMPGVGPRERVDRLGRLLSRRINDAVTIGPVNLVAVALARTPGGAMGEAHLITLIDDLKTMLVRLPYSAVQELTPLDGRAVVDVAIAERLLVRVEDPAGSIVRLVESPPVLLGYFRNGVVHAWAVFALIAALVRSHGEIDRAALSGQVRSLFPFAAAELFLSLPGTGLVTNPARPGDDPAMRAALVRRVDASLAVLEALGFVRAVDERAVVPEPGTQASVGLATLARLVDQPLQRYLLVVSLLVAAGSGTLTRSGLAARSAALAARVGRLGSLQLPQVLDAVRTDELVDTLLESGWVSEVGDRLVFADALRQAARHARSLLEDEALLAITDATAVVTGVAAVQGAAAAPVAAAGAAADRVSDGTD